MNEIISSPESVASVFHQLNPPEVYQKVVSNDLDAEEASRQIELNLENPVRNIYSLAVLLHAVDSTLLGREVRVKLSLPDTVLSSPQSFAGKGPRLLAPGSEYIARPDELCPDAEEDFARSKYFDNKVPGIVQIANGNLEVQFDKLVFARVVNTFEHIDDEGHGHCFLSGMWYRPLPSLYPGSQSSVKDIQQMMQSTSRTDNVVTNVAEELEKTYWTSDRTFINAKYERYVQRYAGYNKNNVG